VYYAQRAPSETSVGADGVERGEGSGDCPHGGQARRSPPRVLGLTSWQGQANGLRLSGAGAGFRTIGRACCVRSSRWLAERAARSSPIVRLRLNLPDRLNGLRPAHFTAFGAAQPLGVGLMGAR